MPWTIPNLVLHDKPVPLANMRSQGRKHVLSPSFLSRLVEEETDKKQADGNQAVFRGLKLRHGKRDGVRSRIGWIHA
jgi:hypothetical protein